MLEPDIVLNEQLKSIETKYKSIINQYINVSSPPLNSINKHLLSLITLYDRFEGLHPQKDQLRPSLAEIFISNKIYFQALSYKIIKQLILRNETAKTQAAAVFQANNCYDKSSLNKLIKHLKTTHKLNSDKPLEEDQAFLFYLLSQPKHVGFFTFDELCQSFTEVNGKISNYLYQLVLTFDHLFPAWLTAFKNITKENASSFIAAMAPLSQPGLARLFPSDDEKKHLFDLLNDAPKTIQVLIDNWPETHVQWLIRQLYLISDKPNDKDPANPQQPNVLGQILEALYQTQNNKLNNLFSEQIRQTNVLEKVSKANLANCLQQSANRIPHLAARQQSLIIAVADHADLFPDQDPAFFHLLCLRANKKTFANISKKAAFQSYFSRTTASQQPSPLYELISTTDDKDKLETIIERTKAQLHSLSSAELLKLATEAPKGSTTPYLSVETLEEILKQRPENFPNDSSNQRALNLAMDIALKNKNVVGQKLLGVLLDHRDFQEAWLRSKIFDTSWHSLGQGFFSKKLPTTIAKARYFLHTDAQGITPLSAHRLNTLIDMFKVAKKKSHKYFYLFGTKDFRDRKTQSFYDQVAQFPSQTDARSAPEIQL